MDLLLFMIDDKNNSIIFPMSQIAEGFSEDEHPFNDFIDAKITVNINGERIQMLKPYSNKITQIKQEGDNKNKKSAAS